MKFPKLLRTVDPAFLAAVRQLRCLACGKSEGIQAHHIESVGARGGDDAWNVIPLCVSHHIGPKGWHRLGRQTFIKRFPHVGEHLKELGWVIDGDQFFHPGRPSDTN